MEVNEYILEISGVTKEHEPKNESKNAKAANTRSDDIENLGTAILDATCSPSNIRYPQDFSLLNEAREKLEDMIDYFHKNYHPWDKPRTYRRIARKEYLALAKSKKRTEKKIRATIRKQLGYVKRDLEYLEDYMEAGYALPSKHIDYYLTIQKLYEQQKYMYENKTHSVEDRIVSISQPYLRPIVRGKAKSPVEFGAKYDVSIDEKGHARLEKLSFDAYNENTIFVDAMNRYKERTGHYPKRVLVDQIYRTRDNRNFCKDHNITMSGPKLGRPSKDKKSTKEEYQDNTDRIEVERFFMNIKINRFVPLRRPDFSDLCNEVPAAARRRPVSQERVSQIIDICLSTLPGAWNGRLNARLADKTLMAITSVATDLDNRDDLNFTPEQRGILLFETAIEALEQTGGRYYWLKEQESIRISKKRIEEAHIKLPSRGWLRQLPRALFRNMVLKLDSLPDFQRWRWWRRWI